MAIGEAQEVYGGGMRSLPLVVLVVSACAAHEPPPRIHEPDEPRPAQVEPEVRVVPETPPIEDAPPGEAATEPVKVVDSSEEDALEQGKRDAQAAIATNELGLETFGYPAPCRYRFIKVMHERYGVRVREVAGCVIDKSIAAHAVGYNEVMEAEIVRRHGADVFERAEREAGC